MLPYQKETVSSPHFKPRGFFMNLQVFFLLFSLALLCALCWSHQGPAQSRAAAKVRSRLHRLQKLPRRLPCLSSGLRSLVGCRASVCSCTPLARGQKPAGSPPFLGEGCGDRFDDHTFVWTADTACTSLAATSNPTNVLDGCFLPRGSGCGCTQSTPAFPRFHHDCPTPRCKAAPRSARNPTTEARA